MRDSAKTISTCRTGYFRPCSRAFLLVASIAALIGLPPGAQRGQQPKIVQGPAIVSGPTIWTPELVEASDISEPVGIVAGPEIECPACELRGSVVEIQNQVLGEAVPLAGTGLALHYRSNRVVGYRLANSIHLRMTGSKVGTGLKNIGWKVTLAGREIAVNNLTAKPNLTHDFLWDGRDDQGRVVPGRQQATVQIRFTDAKGDKHYTQTVPVGAVDARQFGLGGWTLSVQHRYDPVAGIVYFGDGRRTYGEALRQSVRHGGITAVAGTGMPGLYREGRSPLTTQLYSASGIAVAPDGSIYLAEVNNHCVRKITPSGTMFTVAGTGAGGYGGDGGPATKVRLSEPQALALAADGSLYIADMGNHLVRRVRPDGRIDTVAGTPPKEETRPAGKFAAGGGHAGDGGPATKAKLNFPASVAVGPRGELYIADMDNHCIRHVDVKGTITTFAGTGVSGFSGDGGPATMAKLAIPVARWQSTGTESCT